MIVSRKTTDQYNILNNITGCPDCMMSISQLLSLRQNANAVILYPLIVNEIVRYEFTPLIISQNTSNIYLLNNNASGSLPTNFYDGTIAYSDAMTPTDSSMFCYNTNLNRFEERGISIASFIRNNIGYRYYNLSDTSGLEGVIYIPDWIENIYINDELLLNWENITVNLKHNITQATILDMNAATANQECSYNSNTLFTPGTDFRDFAISGTEYNQDMIFADDELMLYKKYESYIQCYSYYHSSSDNGGGWKIYYQGEAIGGYTGGTFGKYDKYFGVAFLVDEEHEYGQIIECYSYYPNTSWNQKHYTKRLITNSNMLHKAYLLIKEILTGAKVKVNYMIPEGNYQYCKLTYKPDYQPENQNDGTSIDISPNASSVNVEGLDENQLYYFTLFTDKSESEPFPFVVGDMDHYPVPTEFKTEYDNIFIMPLSDISNPPGGSSWDYGYQQFIDTYLPHYTDYSYSGLNSSPYMLDVASATTNKDANMKMSSTKIDMLITPDNKIKFRNYVSDVSLNGYSKLQYRYLANYDCKMVGPYSYDSSDVWGDKSFNSDVDLWTYISRNIRFVNVYYGINWDNALIMR